MSSEIQTIIQQILNNDKERAVLGEHTAELKAEAVELGYTKKALAEAMRLYKMEDLDRNCLLTSANKILCECNRAPINPNLEL